MKGGATMTQEEKLRQLLREHPELIEEALALLLEITEESKKATPQE